MYRRPTWLLLAAALLACAAGRTGTAASPSSGDIAGLVRDAQGRPLAGVRARILGGPQLGSARTGSDGRYLLADLIPGDYDLVFSRPGYAPVHRGRVPVAAGATVALDVRLEWASPDLGAAEIVAQDSARAPLPGAFVDLLQGGRLVNRLETDEAGSAIFPGLVPGLYSGVARRPGFRDAAARSFRVRAGATTAAVARMARDPAQAGRVGGVVRDLFGAPVARAAVRVVSGLSGGETTTGNTGAYQIAGLVPGDSYSLRVTAPGFGAQVTGGIRIAAQQLTVVDFTLVADPPGRGSLVGRVIDASGRELPFTTIRITAGPALGSEALTGADGRYAFTGLQPAENYALVARQAGFAPRGIAGITVAAGETTTVNLVLGPRLLPPGSISGTVRESGTGRLLPDVVVELAQGPSAGLATTTDAAGRYLIEEIIPALGYSVRFRKPGFVPASVQLVDVGIGGQATADAALAPIQVSTAGLVGTVRRRGGGVVSGARVLLVAGPSSPLEVVTDAQGAYSFRNLRPGPGHALRVEMPGFLPAARDGIRLADGQTVRVDFRLQRGLDTGSIQGRVLDLIQRPIAGATVRVIDGPARPPDVRTDGGGGFLIEALPPGSYTLDAFANGFQSARRTGVIVSGGGTTTVQFQLLRP